LILLYFATVLKMNSS